MTHNADIYRDPQTDPDDPNTHSSTPQSNHPNVPQVDGMNGKQFQTRPGTRTPSNNTPQGTGPGAGDSTQRREYVAGPDEDQAEERRHQPRTGAGEGQGANVHKQAADEQDAADDHAHRHNPR